MLDALRGEAASRGLDVAVQEVGCIGFCYAEPLVDVQSPGGPRVFYRNVTPEQVPGILDVAASGRWSDGGDVLGTLGEDGVDGVARIEDGDQWRLQARIATRNCGTVDPGDIREYIAAGGYGGLAKALSEMSQEELVEEVKASGLRGRGGAAFPTGVKWGFLQGSNRPNKYVLVNCEEGDPGAYNDKGLIESDPHTVVEGTIIAGRATGANYGYIFIRHGHDGPIDRAKEAIRQAYEQGLLGEDILGSGFSFDMEVALTGDSYVGGRGDGADGGHRGQALDAALPPAVPRAGRRVGQPEQHQQREDAGLRAGGRPAGRRVVLRDRLRAEQGHRYPVPDRRRELPRHVRGALWRDAGAGGERDRGRRGVGAGRSSCCRPEGRLAACWGRTAWRSRSTTS